MTFTLDTYKRFKLQYQNASKGGLKQFKFEGYDFLTDYAKYLLQYLKPKFEK